MTEQIKELALTGSHPAFGGGRVASLHASD